MDGLLYVNMEAIFDSKSIQKIQFSRLQYQLIDQ